MTWWHRGLPRYWRTGVSSLLVLLVKLIGEVDAADNLRSGNHSTTTACVNSGSGPVGCAASPLSRRLQSGLAIGGVCLILLLSGGILFAYCIRKWSKQTETDNNFNRTPQKKTKKKKHSRPRQNNTVFTITHERFETGNSDDIMETDKEHLVFSELPKSSCRHIEEEFGYYSKPVDVT